MAKENKIFSCKQENLLAKLLGWDVVSGSGARFLPGDIKNDEWLGECKTHNRPGHRIEFHLDIWRKLYREAITQLRRPVYFVDDGSQLSSKTWAMTCWLPIEKVKVVEYFGRVSSSVTFDDSLSKDNLFSVFNDSDDIVVYELHFGDDTVWLTSFDMFTKIVGLV
jgi:hypothetical protein